MIVLSFNVRGVGGLMKCKKIRELVKDQRVDYGFLVSKFMGGS